jgi:hypothetical protein
VVKPLTVTAVPPSTANVSALSSARSWRAVFADADSLSDFGQRVRKRTGRAR